MKCHLTSVIPATIADQSFAMKYPYNSALSFTMNSWNDTFGRCVPFTYSAKLLNGSALPSFIIFKPSTRTFKVTENLNDIDAFYTCQSDWNTCYIF